MSGISSKIYKNGIYLHDNFFEFLSENYVLLDYIEGTGTQCINTTYPYNSTNLTYKIEAGWEMTALNTTYQAPYGAYIDESSKCFRIIRAGSNARFWSYCNNKAGSSTRGVYDVSTIYARYDTVQTSEGVLWNNTDFISHASLAPNGSNTTSTFFVCSQTIDSCISKIKMYYFRLYDNDEIKIYLIPAKRKSDSVAGMFDLVSKTFFTSSTDTAFVAGNELDHCSIFQDHTLANSFIEI